MSETRINGLRKLDMILRVDLSDGRVWSNLGLKYPIRTEPCMYILLSVVLSGSSDSDSRLEGDSDQCCRLGLY